MASTLEVKRQYRTYVLQKIRSHFNVTKKDMAEVDLDSEILSFDSLPDFPVYEDIYTTHINTLKLEQILYYDRFVKSPIYAEFINGEDMSSGKYVMALHLNGLIFIIYRSTGYDGVGGIQLNGKDEGFAIVPITNFLNDQYPKEEGE